MESSRYPTALVWLIIVWSASWLTVSCGEKAPQAPAPATQGSDTFTFFDIGKHSVFSSGLRNSLNRILGDDAIERRNLLDLEIVAKGFLKEHFPELDTVNQGLNSPIGERVDHNTLKLMYRYARKKNLPFDYVEIVFSEYTQNPILINIRYRKDAAETLASLEQKYGPPQTIVARQPDTKVQYWRKDNDVLLLAALPDQFGTPRYRIGIYYTENLRALVRAESIDKTKGPTLETKSGKTPF